MKMKILTIFLLSFPIHLAMRKSKSLTFFEDLAAADFANTQRNH